MTMNKITLLYLTEERLHKKFVQGQTSDKPTKTFFQNTDRKIKLTGVFMIWKNHVFIVIIQSKREKSIMRHF
jgi:hypothetical protein